MSETIDPEAAAVTGSSDSEAAGVRALIAGNWKMNGLKEGLSQVFKIRDAVEAEGGGYNADVLICPPFTLGMVMAELTSESRIAVGAQDCHAAAAGAHTGDISAPMLKDAGLSAVIVGHSERRADHGEMDRDVRAKAEAAHSAGLTAIICVGETEGQRRSGLTLQVVERQLEQSVPDNVTALNTVIAYEPVWAIGTGLTPTLADVAEVHAAMRSYLQRRFGDAGMKMRLLYGGSVKPGNAGELMGVENVNGALVGGASLKAADFLGILDAYKL